MQKYRIKITKYAEADIEDLMDFYADLVDDESADKFRDEVFATIASLDTFPEGNPLWLDQPNLHRVNLKKHRICIIYKVKKAVLEVVAIAVFHSLRNPRKLRAEIRERTGNS